MSEWRVWRWSRTTWFEQTRDRATLLKGVIVISSVCACLGLLVQVIWSQGLERAPAQDISALMDVLLIARSDAAFVLGRRLATLVDVRHAMIWFGALVWLLMLGRMAGGVKAGVVQPIGLGVICGGLAACLEPFLAVPWARLVLPPEAHSVKEPLELAVRAAVQMSLPQTATKLVGTLVCAWLVRHRDPIVILAASAATGVGFTLGVIGVWLLFGSPLSVGIQEMLLHVSSAGLLGIAAARTFAHAGWIQEQLVPRCLGIVGLHALYLGLTILDFDPDWGEFSFFAMISFLVLGKWFFEEVHELRSGWSDPISLTAVFLWGMTLLAGATFVADCSTFSLATSLASLFESVATVIPVMYFVHHSLREL